MKKFLVLVMAVMLNCSSAWAENNLLDYDWWRHATVADVKKEIANGADVNAKDNMGRTALMLACHFENKEIIKTLVKAGTDVNAKDDIGGTALMWASYFDNVEIVKALIDAGADVNAKDNYEETAWYKATLRGNTKVKKVLEEAGAKTQRFKLIHNGIVRNVEETLLGIALFGMLGFEYVTCTGSGLFNPGCMWE